MPNVFVSKYKSLDFSLFVNLRYGISNFLDKQHIGGTYSFFFDPRFLIETFHLGGDDVVASFKQGTLKGLVATAV